MRHVIRFCLVLIVLFLAVRTSFAVEKGGVTYQIPIDYSTMSAVELSEKADFYFNTAILQNLGKVDDNVTNALFLYAVLADKCPDNPIYPVCLGRLYDMIGKDRYAKGNFSRAMGINPNLPEPYFYYGEFLFKRQNYRRALKMYLEAYSKGYNEHPETLSRLNQIYTMFGDEKKAEKYVVKTEE